MNRIPVQVTQVSIERLTRTFTSPSPLISAAPTGPGRGCWPVTKALRMTTSEMSTCSSPLMSPRMNGGLGGAVINGGLGGRGGGEGKNTPH